MKFLHRTSTSERALVSHLSREGKDFTIAIETTAADHPGVGGEIRALYDTVTETADGLSLVADDRSPTGFDKEAQAQVSRAVTPKFRLVVEAQRRSAIELQKEADHLYTPRFADGSEPATRAEQRAWWRDLSMPAKLDAANADPALAAAVVEGGLAMSGLPADVFERLHRTMAEGQLAERIMSDNVMLTEPTADDPIGGKPDYKTARTNAAEKLNRVDAERDLLNRVPDLLANVVTAVALMTGETRQAAFERLSA